MNGSGFKRSGERPWPKERSRFTPIWLDDIETDTEPAYLVEGIIPAGPSLGMTCGPPKSLKSFAVKDLGLHIVAGKPYGGRKVMQGAVIYITNEGVRGVKRRLKAMRRRHDIEGKGKPFALIPAMPNLGTNADDLKELMAEITTVRKVFPDVPVRMIVIDTLRKATPGKSEYDPKDMSMFLANCETLANTFGCHVHFIHHSPRSDNGRGSGTNAIDAAVDVILSVNRCGEGKTPRSTVTVAEMKDGEEGDAWSFEVHSDEVGKASDGSPTFGGYVTIVGPPARRPDDDKPKAKAKLMPPAAKIALDALNEAIINLGTPPPASLGLPRSVHKVVTVEQWRQCAYRKGISAGDTERARQKAFKTAREWLQAENRVGFLDNNVWIVPK
jgi:hypothetical protein